MHISQRPKLCSLQEGVSPIWTEELSLFAEKSKTHQTAALAAHSPYFRATRSAHARRAAMLLQQGVLSMVTERKMADGGRIMYLPGPPPLKRGLGANPFFICVVLLAVTTQTAFLSAVPRSPLLGLTATVLPPPRRLNAASTHRLHSGRKDVLEDQAVNRFAPLLTCKRSWLRGEACLFPWTCYIP